MIGFKIINWTRIKEILWIYSWIKYKTNKYF